MPSDFREGQGRRTRPDGPRRPVPCSFLSDPWTPGELTKAGKKGPSAGSRVLRTGSNGLRPPSYRRLRPSTRLPVYPSSRLPVYPSAPVCTRLPRLPVFPSFEYPSYASSGLLTIWSFVFPFLALQKPSLMSNGWQSPPGLELRTRLLQLGGFTRLSSTPLPSS